jgi:hypothetical protein
MTLSVDDLRVESYSTSTAMQRDGGTVKGHEHSHAQNCLTWNDNRYTVDGCTHDMTRCDATCVGETCPGSTEMGAYTCDDLSCAGGCLSDNC